MTVDEILHLWATRGFGAIAGLFEGPLLIPLEPWQQPPSERKTLASMVPAARDPSSQGFPETTATTSSTLLPRTVRSSMGDRQPATRVQVVAVVKTQRNAYAHVAIGRSSQNDIVLDQASVSRFHADIRWNEGIYSVRDAKSRNGTKLNGAPVVASHGQPLKAGDVVAFGDAACLFCPLEEAEMRQLFALLGGGAKR